MAITHNCDYACISAYISIDKERVLEGIMLNRTYRYVERYGAKQKSCYFVTWSRDEDYLVVMRVRKLWIRSY